MNILEKDEYFGYTPEEFSKRFAEVQWGGVYERIAEGTLTQQGVHAYLCHIPIEGVHDGWPKEIYELATNCAKMLYEYSKTKGFIPNDYSYEDFLGKHGIRLP